MINQLGELSENIRKAVYRVRSSDVLIGKEKTKDYRPGPGRQRPRKPFDPVGEFECWYILRGFVLTGFRGIFSRPDRSDGLETVDEFSKRDFGVVQLHGEV